MGLFGCLSRPKEPPSSSVSGVAVAVSLPVKEEHAAEQSRHSLPEQQTGGDAVSVLHISGDRDAQCSAFRFCETTTSGRNSDSVPRVTCRLIAAQKPPSGPCWELQLPDTCTSMAAGAWLLVQPVAANSSACTAWGMWDLPALAQALVTFVSGMDALLAAMAEVALSVAAPWDVLQSSERPQEASRQYTLPGGGSIQVRSSFIRDPQDGALTPALVLEFTGVTLVPQPAQPSAIDLGPLGLPPRHPRTLDTHDLISERPSGGQAPQPEASTSMAPAAVGRRRPGRGRLSDQVIHEHAATALASMALGTGKQRRRIKNELLRARSMLSAVPCVATLLDLRPGAPEHGELIRTLRSDDGMDVLPPPSNGTTGRVLMQNAQSLEYWGKLTSRKHTGVRDMLALLFKDEPGALSELQQLQHQPEALGLHELQTEGWKRVVQVPLTARLHARPQRQLDMLHAETEPTAPSDGPGMSAVAVGGGMPSPGATDSIPLSPFRNGLPGLPDVEVHRRSPVLLEASTSQGQVSSSWISSNSRHSLSTVDRRRTSPSGRTLDGYSTSQWHSGKFLRSQNHSETVAGDTYSIEGAYVTEAVDEEGVSTYDVAPVTIENFAPGAFQRTSQPVVAGGDRPSVAGRRLSASVARASSTSLSFPQLQEVNPPSVSTRVMKLSLLTAGGSSALGGGGGSIDLRQRSHVELQQPSFSPASAGRRIASMSHVDASGGQGMRLNQQQLSVPAGKLGGRGTRSASVAPAGRLSNMGLAPQPKVGSVHVSQPSWTRGAAAAGDAGEEHDSSQVTSPSTERDKLSPGTVIARGQFQDSSITVVTPRRGGSLEAIMDVNDLPANVRRRRLRVSMSADYAGKRLARAQQRRLQEETQDDFQQVGLDSSAYFTHEPAEEEEAGGDASDTTDTDEMDEGEEFGWSEGGDMDEAGDDEDELDEEDEHAGELTHEVQALRVVDPVTGLPAILLLQTDITARALMEKRMSALTETQLTMLENMLPRQVLEYAIGGAGPIGSLAYQHDQVTVLFMDIVGFTSMSKNVEPHLVMGFLNHLFSRLDEMCEAFDIYKENAFTRAVPVPVWLKRVDTAGDCYIVAGALMTVDEDGFIALDEDADPRQGARNVVSFAQEIIHFVRSINMPHDGRPTAVRVGIHTGSVVSGLVGTKMFKYSLFGDTMNTSSRMESTSRPGCIQISSATYEILEEDQRALFTPTGGVEVKGKGLMATYVHMPDSNSRPVPDLHLGAIVEESPEPLPELSSIISGDMSRGTHSASVGRVTAGLYEVDSGGGLQVPETLQGSVEDKDSSRQRRRSESTSRAMSVATGSGVASLLVPGSSQARRSSFAAYGATSPVPAGAARRHESMVADMFRAAAAVMEQQPQQRDGGLSKYIQYNARPNTMPNK